MVGKVSAEELYTGGAKMMNSLGRAANRSTDFLARAPFVTAVLGHHCSVCGLKTLRGRRWKLAQELVEAWELDSCWRRMFERREGLACKCCDSCSRYRHFASVLLDELGARSMGFENLADYAQSDHFMRLAVAEINRCGALHKFLSRHPQLYYSDYGSTDPDIPSEDLQELSYDDRQFDLVLTTDTLEHVPRLDWALSEIERILKPGGRHIFTVPTVWDGRKTRQRAVVEGGRIECLHPPSYHGVWSAQETDHLVFYEFGNDILEYLKTANTKTTIRFAAGNPSLSVFITVKDSCADGHDPETI